MHSLPVRARYFIVAVIAAGLLGLATALIIEDWRQASLTSVFAFASLGFLFHAYGVGFVGDQGEEIIVSPAGAWLLAASFIFPPWQAFTIGMAAGVGADVVHRKVWYKVAFNGAHAGIELFVASAIFHALALRLPYEVGIALSGILAGLSYYVLNTFAVNTVVSLVTRQSALYTWRVNYRVFFMHNIATISIAGLIAILWMSSRPSIILAALPLLTVRVAIDHLARLRTQTRQAILQIVDILDRRDPSTHQHSERVAKYARLLAEGLSLPADQAALIFDATRLHDIGKIGMSNELLFKPGQFTEEEWHMFKQHPTIGAEVVASFPLFKGAREIIRHHQEKFDGSGYPEGLKGEEIPLGSRIIAVADAYDAMRSERPYRTALSSEQIVHELWQGRGTQFDPKLVDVFLLALAKKGDIPAESLPAELSGETEEPAILHPSRVS